MSNLFKLNSQDLIKGLVVAVIAVVLGALQQAVQEHGLVVSMYDWGSILNLAFTSAVAYLSKNFITDENNTVHLGSIKLGGVRPN